MGYQHSSTIFLHAILSQGTISAVCTTGTDSCVAGAGARLHSALTLPFLDRAMWTFSNISRRRRGRRRSAFGAQLLERRDLLAFTDFLTSASVWASVADPATLSFQQATSPGTVTATGSDGNGSATAIASWSAQATDSTISISTTGSSSGTLFADTHNFVEGYFTVTQSCLCQVQATLATAFPPGGGSPFVVQNVVYPYPDLPITSEPSTITIPAGTYHFNILNGTAVPINGGSPYNNTATSSLSAQLTLSIVAAASTTTTLTASPNPAAFGQQVTLAASVVPTASGGPVPTGTVTFLDGSSQLGTAPLDATGTATLQTASLSVGDHPAITAVYSGDSNYSASTSAPIDQVVTVALTPSSLAWDDSLGGVDYGYAVAGGSLSQATSVALYWSSTPQFADHIGGPIPGTLKNIAAGTESGPYGPIHVKAQLLQNVPDGAAYVLLVTDPSNKIGSFSQEGNVLAVANPLFVPVGQFTFNAEGNDDPHSAYFSRQIHWPGGASGVTIGRGYDLKGRSAATVLQDLTEAGIPLVQAEEIANGAGLSGHPARNFVQANQATIGDITRAQQEALFNIVYPSYESKAERLYDKFSKGIPGAPTWSELDPAISTILIDFAYVGDISRSVVRVAAENSYKALANYIGTALGHSTRNDARIAYLDEYQ